MLRTEMKICNRCGKSYVRKCGEIVERPEDFMDYGMCVMCRTEVIKEILKDKKSVAIIRKCEKTFENSNF